MRKYLIILLTAAGLTLLALAKRLAGDDRSGPGPGRRQPAPPRHLVELPRTEYRYRQPSTAPGKWETYRMGLAILLGSIRFAMIGA